MVFESQIFPMSENASSASNKDISSCCKSSEWVINEDLNGPPPPPPRPTPPLQRDPWDRQALSFTNTKHLEAVAMLL